MQPIELRSQNAQANFHSIRLQECSEGELRFAWEPLEVQEWFYMLAEQPNRCQTWQPHCCGRLTGEAIGEEGVVKSNKALFPFVLPHLSSIWNAKVKFYVQISLLVDSV